MENPIRIQQKIAELNAASSPPGQAIVNEWVAFNGYSALTQAYFAAPQTPVFNPMAGIVVKSFINWRTGEIKIFNGMLFEM